MSPRARPPEIAPADRLGRLALAHGPPPARGRPGGWVPEQPGLLRATALAAHVAKEDPIDRAVEEEPPVDPSTVGALLRSARVDPGHKGVIALVLVGLVAAALAGGLLLRGRPSEQPLIVPLVAGAVEPASGPEVVVDVAGKVRRPGLVRLPVGARVDDAIRQAGGALPGASTASLNLARKLTDGEQVLVGAPPGPASGGPAAGGLLDLNTATLQDFDALPGIGPVLADRIISWRTEHSRFASVDQLREVSGIGESKYQSIKAKVRV